jgi:ribosomal subunit interface protein
VPEDLREKAEEKVAKVASHATMIETAEVRLRESPTAPPAERAACEVVLRGHGRVLRAKGCASDASSAVDLAVSKVAHQVERMKGKLLARSRSSRRRRAATRA